MRIVAETISRFKAKKIQIPAPVRVFTPTALPCSQSTEAILLMIVVLYAMITMPAFERLTCGRIHRGWSKAWIWHIQWFLVYFVMFWGVIGVVRTRRQF